MAGIFELVDAPDGGYRVRMLDGAGALIAVTVTFPTKKAAALGVAMTREIAGTGLIRDLSHDRREVPLRHVTMAGPHLSHKGTLLRQHKHLHSPTPAAGS